MPVKKSSLFFSVGTHVIESWIHHGFAKIELHRNRFLHIFWRIEAVTQRCSVCNFIKKALVQLFSCAFCEISKNTYDGCFWKNAFTKIFSKYTSNEEKPAWELPQSFIKRYKFIFFGIFFWKCISLESCF